MQRDSASRSQALVCSLVLVGFCRCQDFFEQTGCTDASDIVKDFTPSGCKDAAKAKGSVSDSKRPCSDVPTFAASDNRGGSRDIRLLFWPCHSSLCACTRSPRIVLPCPDSANVERLEGSSNGAIAAAVRASVRRMYSYGKELLVFMCPGLRGLR